MYFSPAVSVKCHVKVTVFSPMLDSSRDLYIQYFHILQITDHNRGSGFALHFVAVGAYIQEFLNGEWDRGQ